MGANDSDLYDAQLSTLATSKRDEASTTTRKAGNSDEGKNPEPAKPSGAVPDAAKQALLDRIAMIKGQAAASGAGVNEDIGED